VYYLKIFTAYKARDNIMEIGEFGAIGRIKRDEPRFSRRFLSAAYLQLSIDLQLTSRKFICRDARLTRLWPIERIFLFPFFFSPLSSPPFSFVPSLFSRDGRGAEKV